MSKKIIVAIIAVIATIPWIAFATGNLFYEAHETDVEIYYTSEDFLDVEFDLPIVKINGNVYVPLREAAEKAGMTVDWNFDEWHNDEKVRLIYNIPDIDAAEAFNNIFHFALPDTAEVLNYEHYDLKWRGHEENGNRHFAAKIAIQEKDLEYLNSQFKEWRKISDVGFKVLYTMEYGWWNYMDGDEVINAYETNEQGTIYPRAYIVKTIGGQYYLYATYY